MDFLRGGNQRNVNQQQRIDVNRVSVEKLHQHQIAAAIQSPGQKTVDSSNNKTNHSEPNYVPKSSDSSTDSINKNKKYQFVENDHENVDHDELMLNNEFIDVEDECILNNQSVEEGEEITPRPSSSLLEQSGGRDSGISTESSSYKYQELFTKVPYFLFFCRFSCYF